MNQHRYAMKPMAAGDSGALAWVSGSAVSRWAGFGDAITATRGTAAKRRHTGTGVVRPKGLSEGSTG